jgi:hypothetical protein
MPIVRPQRKVRLKLARLSTLTPAISHARASGPGFGWTAPVPQKHREHMQDGEMLMKTSLKKFTSVKKALATLGIAAALAMTATSFSFAQSRGNTCIPHYDSSGAQTAPYC